MSWRFIRLRVCLECINPGGFMKVLLSIIILSSSIANAYMPQFVGGEKVRKPAQAKVKKVTRE